MVDGIRNGGDEDGVKGGYGVVVMGIGTVDRGMYVCVRGGKGERSEEICGCVAICEWIMMHNDRGREHKQRIYVTVPMSSWFNAMHIVEWNIRAKEHGHAVDQEIVTIVGDVPVDTMRTCAAAAASFFLLSFSAFFARPDSFLPFVPLGAIVVVRSGGLVVGCWLLVIGCWSSWSSQSIVDGIDGRREGRCSEGQSGWWSVRNGRLNYV